MTQASEWRTLVRRDLGMAAVGVVLGLVLWAVLLAGRIDLLGDRVAASIVTGGAALVGFTSVVWFLAGPRDLRRERTLVLAPVFVAAVPALFSLRDLGGGVLVVMMSSLVGFSAAIAAGLAFASRRAG